MAPAWPGGYPQPAETRRGTSAPWGMKAGAGEPGLWAEDQATVGRLLLEAHYLETVWQDCPANKRLAAEYSRNVLEQLRGIVINSVMW